MKIKLGILVGALALALSGPVAQAAAATLSADMNVKATVKLGGHVTLKGNTYYCFGKKATIVVARDFERRHYTDTDSGEVIYTYDVRGTDGDDVIVGSEDQDAIWPGKGNDRICSLGGRDIVANTASLHIWVDGGDDHDRLDAYDYTGPRPETTAVIYGGPGNDFLQGALGRDRLYGGPGNDRIYGDNDFDVCYGGSGRDRLSGCEAGRS